MRLSAKSDYALRVLFTLVDQQRNDDATPISIRELAARNDVPKRFLEQIMIDLREKGFVKSVPGRDGGYLLAKDAADITMGQVVRHFDGILAPIGCVSVSEYRPCSQESKCRFRRILMQVRDITANLMDRSTLASVAMGTPVGQMEVFPDALMSGAGI